MHFFKLVSKFIVVVIGFVVCGPASAQSVMQPGGWKLAMKLSAQNPETGKFNTINESASTMCLSKEFLANDPYLTPGVDKKKMEQKKAKCTISDEKRSETAASWRMVCQTADGNTVDMKIKNSASRDKLTSDIEQAVKKEGQTGLIRIGVNGSFVGECTKEMPRL